MFQSFPADASGKNLKWVVLFAFLINTPFLLILFFTGEPHPTLLIVMILPLAISGLIIYSSYAAARMVYVLGEDDLRISFPLSPLRINYNKIRSADKVETSLILRLFGGSLPGSHWGMFMTSNLGNAQVYATRYKGEFVLLELVDGVKILISPKEPDALLDALKSKFIFAGPTMTTVAEYGFNRRLVYVQVAVVAAAWLGLVFYVGSIYSGLPEVIPVHFGFNGIPNRYGSKVELLVLVGVAALFPSLNTIFSVRYGRYNEGLSMFLSAVFLLAVVLFFFVVNQILQAI
jgi:hypothetical protein